jgi:hypothetical protein
MDIFALVKAILSMIMAIVMALGALFSGGTATTLSADAPIDEPAPFPQAPLAATTSTPLASSPPPHIIAAAPKPAAPAPAPSATPATPALSAGELNTRARGSLVNLLCTTQAGGSFNPISGSGVIIDTRGIILTNAHVAQFFLLRDYPQTDNVACVVRTGSPATPRYTAELLYLPPAWVSANAGKIKDATPTGTGEDDYAFVRITGAIGSNALPAQFPALPMGAGSIDTGQQVLLAAYPAGFLGGIAIATSLYSSSAPATVGQLYSFSDGRQVDLFSLGGSVVSQAGSSGGAVLGQDGKLRGIIVTEIPGETTSERDLRALTLSHIDRGLADAGLGGISAFLSKDAASTAAAFNRTVAPSETEMLIDALTR